MTDTDTAFRDEIRSVIQRHDPTADELRSLAGDIEALADRYEAAEETI